jgi:hypothetical protein
MCQSNTVVGVLLLLTAWRHSLLLSKALIQHFGSGASERHGFALWDIKTTAIIIGREIVQAALSKKEAAVILKDISWLWRTAYNTAVQGCIDWPSEIVSDLFDISREARVYFRAFLGSESSDVNAPPSS